MRSKSTPANASSEHGNAKPGPSRAAPAITLPIQTDRHAILVLAVAFCALYAYFFQGGGWNQNSHFDTIRALVEKHTVEISDYVKNTGDVGRLDGKVYSNKGPGLALVGAPVYFVLYHLEKALGHDIDSALMIRRNAHTVTFFVSGIPAVVLLIMLYLNFRRSGATLREALVLAGGFGAGSLIFPYSGVLMSHVLTACLLFTAWHLSSDLTFRWRLQALAGVLTGMAVVTDLLATPVAFMLLAYAMFAHRKRSWFAFAAGATAIALMFMTYNALCFGRPWITHQTLPNPQFQTEGLVLGMLQAPDLRRIYWLTIHPFRGLFYCCPLFLVPILSWPSGWNWRVLTWEQSIPLTIIASICAFMLCFNGWAGGYCVGPRYMIPMLPFLFAFALKGYRKCNVPSVMLMSVSGVFMFCVTAVQVIIRAPNGGVAPNVDPVGDSLVYVTSDNVSRWTQSLTDFLPPKATVPGTEWSSYNLGEMFGMQGSESVLPALAILCAFVTIVLLTPRQQT